MFDPSEAAREDLFERRRAPSSPRSEADLPSLGIGLLSSNREVAQAAAAVLAAICVCGRDAARLSSRSAATASCCTRCTGCSRRMQPDLPVFGMNRGTVGFLMNEWRIDELAERIAKAKPIRVAPLEMRATTVGGETFVHAAINEVSLLRETRQTAKIEVLVNGRVVAARAGLRRRAGRDPRRIDRL